MKRIVAFVSPMSHRKSQPAADAREPAGQQPNPDAGGRLPSGRPGDNSEFKVEAFLSEGQARRIVASLLQRDVHAGIDSIIDDLLNVGLSLADADACDLYQQIVVAVERKLITRVYAECGRVKTKTSARLGINRNTLHKKLQHYQILDDDHE